MTCIGQEVGRAHYLYIILSGLAKVVIGPEW